MKQITQIKQKLGFTIIELMVVMAITGLVIIVAMPSFTSLNQSSDLTASANELIGAFNRARNEAIRRGHMVQVSAEGGKWQQGYKIWVDLNLNDKLDVGVDETNELIFKQTAFGSGIKLNSEVTSVTFLPNGFSQLAQTGTIKLCTASSSNSKGKNVIILVSGRTKVVDNACS